MPKEKEPYVKRRNRSENFTDEEVEAMIKEVVAKKVIIEGPVTASLTHKMKQTAWEEIAAAAGSVSGITRSVKEMRVKLTNLKSKVKREYIERRRVMQQKGGDYTPPELPLWETLLLGFIGEDALNSIEGIQNLLTSQWLDMEEEQGQGQGVGPNADDPSMSLIPAPAAWNSHNAPRGSNAAFNSRTASQKRTYQEMHQEYEEYDEDSVSPSGEWIAEEKFHIGNERDCLQTEEEGRLVLEANHTGQTGDGFEMGRERLEDAEARIDAEKQKLREERDRLAMDREKLKIDQEKIGVERAKIEVEREKLDVERERVRLQKEKLQLVETHQTKMENIAMERLNLERQRTEMLKEYLNSLDSKPDPVHLVSMI